MHLSIHTILAVAAVVAVAVIVAGCEGIEIVNESDNQVKAPADKWLPDTPIADAYEPDLGGQYITQVYLKKAYYHSIWPGDDVDFSYVDTRQSLGTYFIDVETDEPGLQITVWTRPGKTQGPSKLVYQKTTTKPSANIATVTTTAANPVIAVRCEGNGYKYIRYMLVAQKKSRSGSGSDRINIKVGSTAGQSKPTVIRMKDGSSEPTVIKMK